MQNFCLGFSAATSAVVTSGDSTETTGFPFQPTTLKATSRGLIMKFEPKVYQQ